jgi:2-iminobutanoate/2-iminopropanoate deaminase
MPERTCYSLPGLSSVGSTAPDLVTVGNLFFTSGVRGVDLETGELPQDPEQQFLNAWHNLAALVSKAGHSIDNIGLVTNFIDSQDFRPFINPGWLELFPDTHDRPARKTTRIRCRTAPAWNCRPSASSTSGAPASRSTA